MRPIDIDFSSHPVPPLDPYHKLRLTKAPYDHHKARTKRQTAKASRKRNRAA